MLVEVSDLVASARRRRRPSSGTSDPELPVASAHARLPEEDRAGRVELDRERDQQRRTAAAGRARPTTEHDDVHRALEQPATIGRGAAGASPSSGRPSAAWIVAWGPITSKSRGTMSTWTSISLRSRISSSMLRRAAHSRTRRSRARRRRSRTISGRSAGIAQDGQVSEVVRALARVLVDEADDVHAVLGMLEQLRARPCWPTSPAPTISVFWV